MINLINPCLQIIKKNAHKSFPQCMRKTLSNDEFVAFIGQGQIKRRVFRGKKKLAKIRKIEPYYQKERKKTSKLKK